MRVARREQLSGSNAILAAGKQISDRARKITPSTFFGPADPVAAHTRWNLQIQFSFQGVNGVGLAVRGMGIVFRCKPII